MFSVDAGGNIEHDVNENNSRCSATSEVYHSDTDTNMNFTRREAM